MAGQSSNPTAAARMKVLQVNTVYSVCNLQNTASFAESVQ